MKVGKRQYAVLKEILAGNVVTRTFFPRNTIIRWKNYVDITLTEKIFKSLTDENYLAFDRAEHGGISTHYFKITDFGKQAVKEYEQKNG